MTQQIVHSKDAQCNTGLMFIEWHRMMNREPIRNRAVNTFAARQIQYRPPLTRVFAKAVSYLAAYIDNNSR